MKGVLQKKLNGVEEGPERGRKNEQRGGGAAKGRAQAAAAWRDRGVENSPGAAKPGLGRAGLTRILLEVTCLAREPPVLVKASHAQSLLESRGLN